MAEYSNVLFDVLTQPQSQQKFGIGECADKSTVVIDVQSPELARIEKTTMVQAIRQMSEKLKCGYVRGSKPMHFDAAAMVFTHVHPDLSWGGKKWTIAAKPQGLVQGIDAVKAAMAQVDASIISTAEINAWSTRQKLNASYLVAFDDLPIWSLMLATVAMQNRWPVRANSIMKGAPKHLPSTNPKEWEEWLSQMFERKAIEQVTRLLGFIPSNSKTDQALIDEGNWSSLL